MIERHLGPTLDQTSVSLLSSDVPHHRISGAYDAHVNANARIYASNNSANLTDVVIQKQVLGHLLCKTSEYKNLVKQFVQRPPVVEALSLSHQIYGLP